MLACWPVAIFSLRALSSLPELLAGLVGQYGGWDRFNFERSLVINSNVLPDR